MFLLLFIDLILNVFTYKQTPVISYLKVKYYFLFFIGNNLLVYKLNFVQVTSNSVIFNLRTNGPLVVFMWPKKNSLNWWKNVNFKTNIIKYYKTIIFSRCVSYTIMIKMIMFLVFPLFIFYIIDIFYSLTSLGSCVRVL